MSLKYSSIMSVVQLDRERRSFMQASSIRSFKSSGSEIVMVVWPAARS